MDQWQFLLKASFVRIAAALCIFGLAPGAAQSAATGEFGGGATTVALTPPMGGEFSGLIDIGNGRKMYLECRGTGSPTVVLVAGLKASADDWNSVPRSGPTVFSGVANVTRICAYDRPGTPVGDQPSRSDPVRQPTTAADAVSDLHALLV